ncbi:MAG: hypothetical protein U1C51_02200 [Candidatus Izemoplasmatales bacterium]|nr:hypothetical protein [bacterium]MDZ4196042.1 hypothetical protein [Candidatus Izemoplasmatales bacterium]
MKKLLVVLMLITCTFTMQACFIQFPLFLDVPRIDINDGHLTYDGKEYIYLDYNLWIHYNNFSPITQVGWTHGPYFQKMGVYTFDEDLEKNFIRVEGSTPRIGVNKEYNMIPVFECQINKIWVTENSVGYMDIEEVGFNQLIDFETTLERTSSFSNGYKGDVNVTLYEYPFLRFRFVLYLVEGKYIMRVSDSNLNYTYYPIQEEYYYLFTK